MLHLACRYIALSGDPSDLAAASNNALELGDTAAAARLWAMHCAAGSMKGATAAGDTIYEPPPPATAADARLAACQLRSAALVTPVAGTLGGACEAATRSGHNTTQHVASYRDCRTRDLYDGRRVAIVDRQTPTRGRELSLLEQLLGNIGRLPADSFTGEENLPGGAGGPRRR